jgi:hypothetical protein
MAERNAAHMHVRDHLDGLGVRQEDNIQADLKDVGCEAAGWIMWQG